MNKRYIQIVNILLILLLATIGIFIPAFGFVLLGLIGIFLLLFIGIHIYVYSGIYWSGIKLKKVLRKKDRVTTLDEAKQNISQGLGTIIIEAPTLGWNVNRLWWCPDNELTKSKFDFEDDHEEFISEACENHEKYISEEKGSAKLFDVFLITQRTEKYLIKHFGHWDFYFVPSAMVWFYRKRKDEKSIENE